MDDQNRDQGQLIDELDRLRRRTAELEAVAAERVKIDEVLRRSEERFRALVESASDVTVVLGSQGNIIYLSPNFEKVWGFKVEDVLGQDLFKNIHPDDIPMIGKKFTEIIKNPKTPIRMPIRALYPDGTWHTLDAEARNHLDDPAIGGIVVNFHDVTELKQAQGELKKVNEWFEEIIGLSKTNIDVIDSEFNLRYVDTEWQKVYGDPAGRKCYEYFRGQKEACRDCAIPDTFRTHQTSVAEHVLPRENNRIVEVHTIPFQSADGEWLVSELNVDITERKRMEDALKEKERYFRSLIENSSDGIMVLDRNGKILYESHSCSRLLGYSEGERIGQVVFEPIHPDDIPVVARAFEKVIGGGMERTEVRARHRDGSWRFLETTATSFLDDPAVGGVVVNLRDITERKRVEEALKESDQLFKKLAYNVPGMIYQFLRRPDGTYCAPFSTDSIKDILGCSPEDVRDDFSPVTRVVLPEDLGRLVESIEYSAEHMTPWQCEYRVQVPGKPVSWLLGQSTPEKLADGSVIWHGFNTDITDRKRMEYVLRESEEKYSTLVENATDGVSIIQDQALKFVNKRMSDMSGYTVEELTGMSTFDLVPPDFTPVLEERFRLRAEGKEVPEIFETRMLCKDGTVKEMESSTKLIQYEGRPAVIAITRDVTERKRMDKALQESEDKYSTLVENAIECVTINRDEDKRIVYANKRMSEVSGYSIEELLGMTIIDLIPPDFFPVLRERFRMRMEGQEIPDILETRLLCKDGTIKELETSTRLIEYQGSPAVMSITRDFTERRRMEEALRASEEKYRLLAENASDVIMLMDMNARAVYFSPSVTRLLGYSVEEALAGTMDDRMTPASMEKAVKHFMAGLHRERRKPGGSAGQTLELEMIHKNGSIVIVEMTVSFIRDESGKPTGMMAILRDITDRKKTEARIIELSNAFMATLDPVLILDMEGNVRNVNESARKLFETDEIGVSALEPVAPEDREVVAAALQELITSGQPAVARYNIVTRSGRRVPLESSGSLMLDANGKPVGIVVVARDLIERRQAEAHQKLAAEILGILNEPLALPDAINRILIAIKRETGFYAVGIRLKKDEDFPYFVQNGFSEDFLLTENTIVVRDSHGGICRDKDGNVSLECTCGLVLSGKTDPSNPLFTPGGSAWTNDSPALLDVPLEEDPRHHPRNRCIHTGFQSVALMPIRSGNEIVGLLQLNDRRKGCFTPEMIRFFEGIAASIGVALMRKQADDALRESEERYRMFAENASDALWIMDMNFNLTYHSGSVRIFGYTAEEMLKRTVDQRMTPESVQTAFKILQEELDIEQSPDKDLNRKRAIEVVQYHKNGSIVYTEETVSFLRDENGKTIGIIGVTRDITQRKRAEEALRESEEKYRLLAENATDVIAVLGMDRRLSYISPSITRLLGYTVEEALAFSMEEIYTPESYAMAAQIFTEELAIEQMGQVDPERTRTIELELYHKNGSVVPVEVNYRFMRDETGKPVAILSMVRDVTERRRAESALRESEVKYRDLFEQTLLGMEVVDGDTGKILLANHSMARMFCFKSPGDMVGIEAIRDHILPEDMDWVLEQLAQALVNPEKREIATLRARKVDGRIIWVTGSATALTYEGKKAVLISLIDVTEVKEAEEALTRINKAVESSSDAIGISDAQGHHFYHNRAFAELFEYTPEELEAAGGGPAAFANKHVARKVFDTIMGGGSWIGEVEMVSKSGRRFTVLERADAIKDEKGKVIGLVGVHTDITERKKAEEKLRETRDYMENLIEHANVPMVVWTPDFRITRFNRAFERLTGMKAKSVIGKDLEILFPKGTRDRSMSFIRTAMRGARWEVVEIPIANLDGDVRTVLWNISPIYAEDGKTPMAIIAQGQDITERKKAEEALRESEELSRSMLESAAMGIYLLQNKRFIYVNPMFEEIVGYSSEELLGQEAIDFVHPDDRDTVRTKAVENIQGASAQPYEFRALRKDGRQIWVMERVTPVRYKGRRAVLASFMETTEHKKAEVELERAYEELKTAHERMVQSEKLRAMGEMASGIAHDFNNMLAVILGRTQLVIDDVKDDKVKKGIQIIEQAALDAAKTVKRLQDFARIRVEHPFEPLDVNEVVEGVLKMVESRRVELEQTKGIAIKVTHELGTVGRVSGDAAELREALLNILFNALDAMPTGGKLTVKSKQEEEWVQIIIKDTGVGIPEKVKSKVFQPFFTTKASKGSGLGLSVTYGIIARHSGMIKFDSEVGKGTTFYIRLPLAVEEVKKQARKSKAIAVKPASILTVDDEPEVLKALGLTLEYFGHWVKDFTRGADAIKAFKEGKYDIVITDLGMPEMSGWDVARAIKKIKPEVPVLLITGWVIDLDEEKKKLVNGVISKPFSRESIAAAIAEVFPAKKKRVVKKKTSARKSAVKKSSRKKNK